MPVIWFYHIILCFKYCFVKEMRSISATLGEWCRSGAPIQNNFWHLVIIASFTFRKMYLLVPSSHGRWPFSKVRAMTFFVNILLMKFTFFRCCSLNIISLWIFIGESCFFTLDSVFLNVSPFLLHLLLIGNFWKSLVWNVCSGLNLNNLYLI